MEDSSSTSRFSHSSSKVDLSEFIISHNDSEERERGNGEMGEGNLSGTERLVDEGQVSEECDKNGLKDESSVSVHVDHTLLGDGESASLADHQIGPLYAHDGDEVTTLGESESFSSVTDLRARNNGVLVEIKTFTFVPSASGPGVGGSAGVEKTDIDTVVLVTVPVECGLVRVAHVVGVSVVKGLGVVNIGGVRDVTIFEGKLEGGGGANTVIVENVEIGEESSRGLNNTNLQVSKGDKFGIHKMVSLGVTGVSFHDIKLRVLIGERDGGNHIGTEINAENEDGGEG